MLYSIINYVRGVQLSIFRLDLGDVGDTLFQRLVRLKVPFQQVVRLPDRPIRLCDAVGPAFRTVEQTATCSITRRTVPSLGMRVLSDRASSSAWRIRLRL